MSVFMAIGLIHTVILAVVVLGVMGMSPST